MKECRHTFMSMTTFIILILYSVSALLTSLIWPLEGGGTLLQQVCSPFQGNFISFYHHHKECATKPRRKHNMSHNTATQNRKHFHSRSKEMRTPCLHLILTFLGRSFVHKTFKWSNAGLTLSLLRIYFSIFYSRCRCMLRCELHLDSN